MREIAPRPGSYGGVTGDRAGDPLDGMVNLFDLSLILAVGFLLAALSALGATDLLTKGKLEPLAGAVGANRGTLLPGQPPVSGEEIQGQGVQVGTVFRLNDGRYVYLPKGGGATGSTGATSSSGATGAAGSQGGSTGATSSGSATPSTGTSTPSDGGGSTAEPSSPSSSGGSAGSTTTTPPPTRLFP